MTKLDPIKNAQYVYNSTDPLHPDTSIADERNERMKLIDSVGLIFVLNRCTNSIRSARTMTIFKRRLKNYITILCFYIAQNIFLAIDNSFLNFAFWVSSFLFFFEFVGFLFLTLSIDVVYTSLYRNQFIIILLIRRTNL